MPRFKSPAQLQDQWASLAVLTRRFTRTHDREERARLALEAMTLLARLREDFGEELRDAIGIVSNATTAINTSRTQQIAQYHRHRIGKLEHAIAAIDETLAGGGEGAPATLQVAELNSQRTDLAYQLKDHAAKVDRRAHGVHLARMRRRQR